jgi:hypothetical protein
MVPSYLMISQLTTTSSMSARVAVSAPIISCPFAVPPVKDNVLYLSQTLTKERVVG